MEGIFIAADASVSKCGGGCEGGHSESAAFKSGIGAVQLSRRAQQSATESGGHE